MRKILQICFLVVVVFLSNGCIGKDSNGLLKSPCREMPVQQPHTLETNNNESVNGY